MYRPGSIVVVLEKMNGLYTQTPILSKMSIQLSASVLSSNPGPRVLAVKIFPNPIDASLPSKHLALLLDVSGSMEGTRIQAVKRTIHLLIDSLRLGDRLSLIPYSSRSTVAVDAVVMGEDRSALHRAVESLVASGGTNLESAILACKELLGRTTVDSVFLLTDGHINEGLTTSAGLLRILGANVPPLHTLGFGSDYNVRTLKNLSVSTRGSHTFADVAELIPKIVGDIVGGLTSEVATKGTLVLPTGWRCLEMGYEEGDESYTVGTLIAEKPQWVVLEAPADAVVPTHLTYSHTTPSGHIDTRTFPVDASISDIEVCEQWNRTRVARVLEEVVDHIERRFYDGAKRALDNLYVYLHSSLAKDTPFVIRLLAQVDEMRSEVDRPRHGHDSVLTSRMVSNQVALGVQRGIVSRIDSAVEEEEVGVRVYESFSSPAQRVASGRMEYAYSQQVEDPR